MREYHNEIRPDFDFHQLELTCPKCCNVRYHIDKGVPAWNKISLSCKHCRGEIIIVKEEWMEQCGVSRIEKMLNRSNYHP